MSAESLECIAEHARMAIGFGRPLRHRTREGMITHVGIPTPRGSGRWKNAVPDIVREIEQKQYRFGQPIFSGASEQHNRDICR